MNDEFINLEFIGVNGVVLRTYAFPKHSTALIIVKDHEFTSWIIRGCTDMFPSIERELMKKVHFIKGISQLEKLNTFWITLNPPEPNVLLRFDRWPEAEDIVSRVKYFAMPRSICPVRLDSDLPAFFRSFLHLHRRLVETSLGFLSINIPSYVIMWICDFLPLMNNVAEWKKIKILSKIKDKKKVI